VSVLKGANATALFGERAKGGAIVVTTKKRGPKQGIGVEFTQSVMADKVYILPEYQNLYAGGGVGSLTQYHYTPGQPAEWQALDGKYFPDYTDDASWGPRMTGQEYIPWYAWFPGTQYSFKTAPLVAQPDNARDFWETGVTSTTNAAFSKNGPGYSTRISFTNQYVKGLLPSTNSKRNNIFFSGTIDLNEHFTMGVNGTYSTTSIRGEFVDGYANQSSGSFNQWFHRHNDMKIMRELAGMRAPNGNLMSWNFTTNPDGAAGYDDINGNYWYNYYDYFANQNFLNGRDRLFGDFYLRYKLNNHFNVRATIRKNQLTTYTENITTSLLEQSATQTGVFADYTAQNTFANEYNYEGLATYSNTYFNNKLAFNVTGGGNVLRTLYKDNSASTVNGLNIPNLYSIANSAAVPTVGNTRQASRVNSLFAQGDVEWNKWASVTFAVRNDWYSTLDPKIGNSLFSPSVGASFVVSEFTKDMLPWLSFAKVFGSWGKKPTSIGIYVNNFGYSPAAALWNGNFLMGTPNSVVDENLKGSLITTYEAGFDLRLFKNRFGLNFVYYNEDNDKEPLSVQVDPVSGFTNLVVNAVHVKREGVELQLTASVIKGKDLTWDVSATFGYIIKNPVKNLYQNQQRVILAGGAFGTRFARAFQEVGSDWGQLIGGGIKRNADGLMVVDPNTGYYIRDLDKHWGSVVPKTTGGFINTLSYKNFVLNFSLDYQIGGKFFSLSESWGWYSGLLAQTAETNDKGNNIRDAVANGGGVHVVGVSSVDEKTPVDKYVTAITYFHQFFSRKIAEPFIHDLTYVKIREASLAYRIPVNKIGNLSKVFQGASISLIARNPWIIYRDSKNFDPSEISGVQGEDGQLPSTRSLGASLKFVF
jgi:outer membrane receptor protein involved in Fe transport